MRIAKDIRLIRGLLGICVVTAVLGARPAAGGALNWEWYVGAFVGGFYVER